VNTINLLRKRRFELGLTLDQVFLNSGGRLHPARLSRFERGILLPSANERKVLVEVLGLAESELFGLAKVTCCFSDEADSHE